MTDWQKNALHTVLTAAAAFIGALLPLFKF